ncbi:MAG: TrmB family transcriptional regulator [Candidatus Bathyarchaeia archaeon]
MSLGLTLVQAKTYVALCKLESATVKAIAKVSNLARQDVYRTIPALQHQGLVEMIVASPSRYRAVPMKSGVSSLLHRRSREHTELRRKTAEFLLSLTLPQTDSGKSLVQEDGPQFVVTSEISLLFRKLMERTEACQTSIDSVGTWENFESTVSTLSQGFQNAVERGVRIRSVTEKPENGKLVPKCVSALRKSPFYELRFVRAPAPVTMSILDRKELNIAISASNSRGVPSLWSNNPAILSLATTYFEEVWSKASALRGRC